MKSQTKKIGSELLRRNREHPRYWDLMETKGGGLTGRVTYTGTVREIREILRDADRQSRGRGGAQ